MCNMYGSFYMFQCFHMDDWHKDQFLKKKKKKEKKKKNIRDKKNLLVMNVKGKYKIKERNTFCL